MGAHTASSQPYQREIGAAVEEAALRPRIYTQAQYARDLRAPAYGLWAGKIEPLQFYDAMVVVLFTGLEAAWQEGARKAGILPDEMTNVEVSAMQQAVLEQIKYIGGLGLFIQQRSKANRGLLRSVMPRLGLWLQRWRDFANRGYAMAMKDRKLKWRRNPAKQSCASCLKLDGKVKRASQWAAANIFPMSHDLECGGFLCGCEFVPTDEPMSKGPLPRLP